MGRHAAPRSSASTRPAPAPTPPRRWPARLLLATIGLAIVALAAALIAPGQALARLPWTEDATCRATAVDLLTSPDIRPTVERLVAPLQGDELPDGRCVAVAVRSQDPITTVRSAAVLPADRAPQLWVPDSSLWVSQLAPWRPRPAGRLASSPVVLATGETTAKAAGWDTRRPSWAEAMQGKPPLALPDLAARADGLNAVFALWRSLGKGTDADKAVAGALLAADRLRSASTTPPAAPTPTSGAGQAVQPRTEQAVIAAARSGSGTVAVYPQGASPALDYPVLQMGAGTEDPVRGDAVRTVLERLLSQDAQALVRADGFRDRAGALATPPTGAGINADPVPAPPLPDAKEVAALLDRLARLARPSRMLVLIDTSLSMVAQLPSGVTRIQLAAAAADAGADLLPNAASVGLWSFAFEIDGSKDYRELLPLQPLGSVGSDGVGQRAALDRVEARLPSQLTPGGTGLYDSVLAGVREVQRSYDPRAVNSVIVFTDGANEDSGGISRQRLLATLRSEANAKRPVPVFALGIGPDADLAALRAMTEPTGGRAYAVGTPAEVQAALYDGLNRRRPVS